MKQIRYTFQVIQRLIRENLQNYNTRSAPSEKSPKLQQHAMASLKFGRRGPITHLGTWRPNYCAPNGTITLAGKHINTGTHFCDIREFVKAPERKWEYIQHDLLFVHFLVLQLCFWTSNTRTRHLKTSLTSLPLEAHPLTVSRKQNQTCQSLVLCNTSYTMADSMVTQAWNEGEDYRLLSSGFSRSCLNVPLV